MNSCEGFDCEPGRTGRYKTGRKGCHETDEAFESPGSYEVHVWTSRALECLGVLRRSDDFEVGLLKINRDHLESSHLEDISSVR